MRLLDRLAAHTLDKGTPHFGPSTLAITTVDVGNPASNVIPAEARATVNIRFNDAHSGASLSAWIEEEADRAASEFGVGIAARFQVSGESFLTAPGPFTDLVARAVAAETGVTPELSTTGGTSDARYIQAHCPVVEFGLVGATMHQVDEHVEIAHIHALKAVYTRILAAYFAALIPNRPQPRDVPLATNNRRFDPCAPSLCIGERGEAMPTQRVIGARQ